MHGFGAFLEHFRDNINCIAEGGNRVWAITLLGFGRSEKPNVVYTEVMWAELLKDFIIEVVGEPVHLVGNSMGGMDNLLIYQFIFCFLYHTQPPADHSSSELFLWNINLINLSLRYCSVSYVI